jgi:hypothetical protein
MEAKESKDARETKDKESKESKDAKDSRESKQPGKEAEQQQCIPGIQEKEKLLQISEISLWLDTYDDIFSDFDPRPYSQRALSDDFLLEAKKASIDKTSGTVELKFLIPSAARNPSHEQTIKKRLRSHFSNHFNQMKLQMKQTIKEGIVFVVLGILIMFVATSIIMLKETENTLLLNFLIILLEPAGWFLFWEGMNTIIFKSRNVKPDLAFYKKMSRCEVSFISY